MTSPTQSEGAWIFVSHSNKDIGKIREIRNELERRGHNPVLFFLKCMENTETDDRLLWQLIEREIKARNWFILCDSPNARNSMAVMREMELVKSMAREGKVIETIDLNHDLQTELHKLVRLSKRATVFLSYSRKDQQAADRVQHALLKHDYRVWDEPTFTPGHFTFIAYKSALEEAATRGFVLLLLSPTSLTSDWCKYETIYALEYSARALRSNVIPVVIAPLAHDALPPQLANIQWFDLTTEPFDERVDELIRSLKTREME